MEKYLNFLNTDGGKTFVVAITTLLLVLGTFNEVASCSISTKESNNRTLTEALTLRPEEDPLTISCALGMTDVYGPACKAAAKQKELSE